MSPCVSLEFSSWSDQILQRRLLYLLFRRVLSSDPLRPWISLVVHSKDCPQFGRPGFDPWVGKIPWRRAWQPFPVFLSGESPWTEDPGGLQSMGLQRVRHNWATKHISSISLFWNLHWERSWRKEGWAEHLSLPRVNFHFVPLLSGCHPINHCTWGFQFRSPSATLYSCTIQLRSLWSPTTI